MKPRYEPDDLDFGFEMIHFPQAILGAGMTFWRSGDTNSKAARLGMPTLLIEAHGPHEVGRMTKLGG